MRFTAIVLAASLLLADISFAATHEEEKRMTLDLYTATMLILTEAAYGFHIAQVKDMEKTYESHYARDHRALGSGDRVNPAMGGYTAGTARVVGYRNAPPPYRDYAGAYIDRADTFDRAVAGYPGIIGDRSGLRGNNINEAEKMPEQAQTWIKNMNQASRNADGYIQLAQAGTQEANYFNMLMTELRADTMRQTDVQAALAAEEAQDGFDDTFAFEMATGTWKNTGTGTKY